MNYTIKLKLMSDLCVTGGDGFSSVIDTDVCYDRFGIPFIPAKRIKGCLLEAAEQINADSISDIFGVSGNASSGALYLDNGFIADYTEIQAELENYEIDFERVLDLFTYTRANTAINNDVAKDNSLRFTRVVKKLSPITDDSLVFYINCICDEKYEKSLIDICKAMRNIGYNRNRGLGAVKCELIRNNEHNTSFGTDNISDNFLYNCDIFLKNISPLMLSEDNSDITTEYISGTKILGYFAGRYINKNLNGISENADNDDLFKSLFLKCNVIFSNFYITNSISEKSMPVPVTYSKMKNSERTINTLVEIPDTKEDTPKPIKNKFCTTSGILSDVKTEIIYHHSKKTDNEILYTQRVLSKGQVFAGSIRAKGKYIKELLKLINEKDCIRVGKSKTAQYGGCIIERINTSVISLPDVKFAENDKLIVCLTSDLLLLKNSVYSNNSNELFKAIADKLGIEGSVDFDTTSLLYTTAGGYNSKWNLQKPHCNAFGKGSVIVFNIHTATVVQSEFYLGEKSNEGFGHCHIYKASDMPKLKADTSKNKTDMRYFKPYYDKINEIKNLEDLQSKAIEYTNTVSGITSSLVGRITMMINEATDYKNLLDNVNNMKESVSKKTRSIIEKSIVKDINGWKNQQAYLLMIFTTLKYQIKKEDMRND